MLSVLTLILGTIETLKIVSESAGVCQDDLQGGAGRKSFWCLHLNNVGFDIPNIECKLNCEPIE